MITGLEKIPPELRGRPQWVLWRQEVRSGKTTKVPYNPTHPGRRAKANDPSTWGGFEKTLSIAQASGFSGVGFEFAPPHCGLDLDRCRDPKTGAIKFCAQLLINFLDSYIELSPSKTGLHAIIKGRLPEGAEHTKTSNCGWKLEVYDSARFFTMTGLHLDGAPLTIEDRQAELTILHKEIFGEEKKEAPRSPGPPSTIDLSDQELIDKAHQAADGEKFGKLWRGDWSDHGSQSEADYLLAHKLAFWTNKDPERIDRLFRQSGLCQDPGRQKKWERLSAKTIKKAIANTPEGYTGRRLPEPTPQRPQEKPEQAQAGQSKAPPQKGIEREKKPSIIEITGADLLKKDFPEPRWAVPDLLPEGYGVIGGRPKIGKSWMAFEIALAIVLGGNALGSDKYRANQGSVRYLALEDPERRLKNRMLTLLQEGESQPALKNIHLVTKHPRLDQGGVEALDSWLTEHPDCHLVIIDTLSKIKPRKKRNDDAYADDMDFGGQLQDLANKHRICLLVVHHTRKNKPDTEDFIDDLFGSTGITAAPDFLMVLSRGRNEDTGLLQITGRELEETELAVKFGKAQGTWTLLGPAREYNMSQQRLSILNVLKIAPDPLTPKEISEMTGISHGSVKQLVSELFLSNLITKPGYGKYRCI